MAFEQLLHRHGAANLFDDATLAVMTVALLRRKCHALFDQGAFGD
ncbi:hypothetical protein ABIC32_001431 [Brevundimonas sp. 1080]